MRSLVGVREPAAMGQSSRVPPTQHGTTSLATGGAIVGQIFSQQVPAASHSDAAKGVLCCGNIMQGTWS